MSKVAAHVEEIIQPILEELNYELVDVEYVKEGPDFYLRIAIDKDGGVDLNDCTIASEKISEVMDNSDPIKEPYFMDVSSPGAERPLKKEKDYLNAIDQPVFISLYEPIDGDKDWLGVLKDVTEESITLEVKIKTRKKDITLPRTKIAKARRSVML
ncbi:ribosome maturation factor RimP [Mammaliicoccus stepanovicii]|uniref:Ribosome maturation factor RimP n=1 Tax=Mammaliicoccus stepanovicii TaxID=643214 RepID=A0A239ZH22_9STAP|nr:ribosome maturation factor RimP [Mammaliicoccus stepanovicii]PNZ78009.1 ribosome maturation factor RimP [Mammaliicoccus stepanovicii]GGI41813.1 ribosome maturation factor RimP [Mammaliicoccus stepanovicii]SNV70359.1 transcription termination protein NusA-like protein [Mammaliicoccus stepanovicii]